MNRLYRLWPNVFLERINANWISESVGITNYLPKVTVANGHRLLMRGADIKSSALGVFLATWFPSRESATTGLKAGSRWGGAHR